MKSIDPADLEALFNAVPDVLFFVKDREGRYTHVNQTMLRRLGLKSRKDLIGKRVAEVYPSGLGANYANQDEQVLAGEVIDNLLELHLFANREPGWCLTCKRPLVVNGKVQGIIGISRDLGPQDGHESQYEKLRLALAYLNANYAQNVRMQALVEITGFSMSKLQRSFRKVFQLTPQQVLAASPADGDASAARQQEPDRNRPCLRFQRSKRLRAAIQASGGHDAARLSCVGECAAVFNRRSVKGGAISTCMRTT